MGNIRISENIVPVSEFKAKAAEWLERIMTGETVVITQNGRAAGVVISPLAYDEMTEKAEFIGAVKEGLSDVEAGRTISHADVATKVRKRLGARRK